MKLCKSCGINKNEEDFGRLKSSKDGLRTECKDCRKKYYYDNHDKMLEQKKNDYKKHKEERDKKSIEYYYDNQEQLKTKGKEYYNENKEEIRKREHERYFDNLDENRAKKRENEAKRRLKKREWIKNNLITVEYPENYKICSICNTLKEITNFNFKKGKNIEEIKYRNFCKQCQSEQNKEYRLENLDELRAKDREKSKDENIRLKRREQHRQYRNSPEFLLEYDKPENRLIRNMTQYIRFALHNYDLKKNGEQTMMYIKCSREFFYRYIESQFLPGMNWNNYGNKQNCWSLDHYIPKEAFNLIIEEEQDTCFNWRNCRPLWHGENESKGDLMPDGTRASITKNNYTLDDKKQMIMKRLESLNINISDWI